MSDLATDERKLKAVELIRALTGAWRIRFWARQRCARGLDGTWQVERHYTIALDGNCGAGFRTEEEALRAIEEMPEVFREPAAMFWPTPFGEQRQLADR